MRYWLYTSVILIFFCYVFSGAYSAAPSSIYEMPTHDAIAPHKLQEIKIWYQDNDAGFDLTTASIALYKWNGSSWGSNVASTYVDIPSATITQNLAEYPFQNLTTGKYKYEFQITSLTNIVFLKENTFYIDAPSLVVSTGEADMGYLGFLKSFSSEVSATVQTIGASYTLIANASDVSHTLSSQILQKWNSVFGWGYDDTPYNQVIVPMNGNITLASKNIDPNANGQVNTDVHSFKLGGKIGGDESAGEYEGDMDFVIHLNYCNEYDTNGDCVPQKTWITDDGTARKWENNTYARSCYYYRHPSVSSNYIYRGDIGDGWYWIDHDNSVGTAPLKVHCDMTTDRGGWTRYTNITGNYSFTNATDCWLGNIINNTNLFCFNPNRFGYSVEGLLGKISGNEYIIGNTPSAPSTTTATSKGGYRCAGHQNYMTVMSGGSTVPNATLSNISWIRLGWSYCDDSRNIGGIAKNPSYMNYDIATDFGPSSAGKSREVNAKPTELYFRETNPPSEDTWPDGSYAKDCYEYKNPTGGQQAKTTNGYYQIDPDGSGSVAPFSVYCDMTTSGGGWTRYADIKGNYTFAEAKDCWLGTDVNSSALSCFNPNRKSMNARDSLMVKQGGINYVHTLSVTSASTTITTGSGTRKCLGNTEYMTIMRRTVHPLADTSDTEYIRLGRNFCSHLSYSATREVGGRYTGGFMNYSNRGFGPSGSGKNREGTAVPSEIYIR